MGPYTEKRESSMWPSDCGAHVVIERLKNKAMWRGRPQLANLSFWVGLSLFRPLTFLPLFSSLNFSFFPNNPCIPFFFFLYLNCILISLNSAYKHPNINRYTCVCDLKQVHKGEQKNQFNLWKAVLLLVRVERAHVPIFKCIM